jgi:hypothetical protein
MECKNIHFIHKFIDKDVYMFAAGEERWVLLRLLQLSNGDDQQVSKDLFIEPKSEHCLALSLTKSLLHSSCWDLNDVTLAKQYQADLDFEASWLALRTQ